MWLLKSCLSKIVTLLSKPLDLNLLLKISELWKLEDFNILWRSPSVPQDPFVYSGKLCDPIKKAISSTFLDLGNDASAQKFLANLKSSKFVPMSDKDYDVIRTLAKAKAEFKKKNKK